MLRTAASALACLTASALIAVTAPAAHAADTPGCTTRAEYRAVKKGFSRAKVARVFDTAGKRMSIASGFGNTYEIREYKTCSRFSSIVISYDNGRLDNKSAVWVS